MTPDAKPDRPTDRESGGVLNLALLSVVVGAAAGLLTATFRLSLQWADQFRNGFIDWAHGLSWLGLPLVVVTVAVAAGVAALLVRRLAPSAKGSGIPHVEAVLRGDAPPGPPRVIAVKFFGGVLAIGAGLALGREGPSVQMGAVLGRLLGGLFRRRRADVLALLAAGAGAGLATAFNAPVAGAVFILEEVVRRLDVRHTIATLGASACAIAASRVLVGPQPDFHVEPLLYSGSDTLPLFLALGVVAGFLGVAYNRAILGALAAQERLRRWPVEARAAVVGAVVGLAAWFLPSWVGGGEAIAQGALAGEGTVLALSLALLFRFALGPMSYSAATPGGLFAPMLAVGAQGGLIYGLLCAHWFPGLALNPVAFAVVGMAAFFTATVRAPVTGIALITEITASFTLLLPMVAACFAAMVIPTMLRADPIYDSLAEPARRQKNGG